MAYTDYIDPGNSGGSVPTPDTSYQIRTSVAIIFECEICKTTFKDEKQLNEHRYTTHPIKSPLIIIKNEQLGHTKKRFFEKLTPDDIRIENCSHIVVNDKEKITPDELIKVLSNQVCGFLKLDLSNKECNRAYEIEFSVANKISLEAIEEAFTTHFRQDDLTLQKINSYTDEVKLHESGQEYAEAYLDYLYGVLAKEQNEEILTSFTEYVARFNKAYDVLRYYPRPLACSVCAIISFNNNFFESSQTTAIHLPNIFSACDFIQNGKLADSSNQKFNGNKLIPIDWITEKIIKLLEVSPDNIEELAEHEKWLKSGRVPSNDKDKIRVMLARKYKQSSNASKVMELLKSLRNKPDFEAIVNNISDKT
jgi:hypothetical protein